MAASSYFMQTASEISDMAMSSWENRNTTCDILSQKQSDATLGFERVYDTETGDVYKAYNGFTDDYSGTRFAPVADDMYLKATSGEIVRESGTGSSSLVSFRKVSISENASATGTATYYDGKGIFRLVEGTDISDQDVSVRPDSDSASGIQPTPRKSRMLTVAVIFIIRKLTTRQPFRMLHTPSIRTAAWSTSRLTSFSCSPLTGMESTMWKTRGPRWRFIISGVMTRGRKRLHGRTPVLRRHEPR